MVNSVYIHIPFCNSICSYCDFCKLLYNDKYSKKYLESLKKEIIDNYHDEIINTLYIGGGSPSSLSLEELRYLFDIIKIFKLSNDYEFTIEVNISDINEEMLKLFKDNNVNRLSIGIETVNPKYMEFLNRYNDKDLVLNKVNLVKKYFDNYNLDLMYAFPKETLGDVIDDLSFVISLNPKHISIYSLIIEEHTKIFIDGVKPIDEEIEADMYYNIIKTLKDNGYNHYEISNFAKDGYDSKHNLVYWNNEHYYGFGLGASGYINDIRYTNTRNINNYFKGNYKYLNDKCSKEIDMENELILGLRKISGINKNKFYSKYGKSIYDSFDIIDLVENKSLIDDGNNIFIPEDKLYISNSILVNFIGGSK